jgi:hypothetical protein
MKIKIDLRNIIIKERKNKSVKTVFDDALRELGISKACEKR